MTDTTPATEMEMPAVTTSPGSSAEPPRLPHGWSLGPERSVAEIVDTYLDYAETLIKRGWALRRYG